MRRFIVIISSTIVIIGGFYFFITVGQRLGSKNLNKSATRKDVIINTSSTGSNSDENYVEPVAPKIELRPDDCDKGCSRFKKEDEKEYCAESCGLTTFFDESDPEVGTLDDCTDEVGIQKDYCLKDIAIENKDASICNQIKDANIRKSCSNRLTEDVLEQQGGKEADDY